MEKTVLCDCTARNYLVQKEKRTCQTFALHHPTYFCETALGPPAIAAVVLGKISGELLKSCHQNLTFFLCHGISNRNRK